MSQPYTVAIIGAGPQGLAALKNLLEEREGDSSIFKPTLFEARGCIGGLWAFSDDPQTTTVLQSTLGNVCRWRNCFGDFPVRDDEVERHGDGRGVYQGRSGFLKYLERYVETFGLRDSIRLNSKIIGLDRVDDEKQGKWEISVETEKTTGKIERKLFDKVIVSTGQYSVPLLPHIEGIPKFAGSVLHSKHYKRPSDFDGKTVLLVGFGNTAADISAELVGHAHEIYLSHRHGNYIFPRITNGKPVDMFSTRRMKDMMSIVKSLAPVRSQALTNRMVENLSDKAVTLQPEWGFKPVPPLILSPPIISDTLIKDLASGSITSVTGIRRIIDSRTIELQDSTKIKADCIIFCTGYKADYSLAPGIEFESQDDSSESNSRPPIPRLYQNIFAPTYADSLAFLNNWVVLPSGICEFADLATMAIAQVWRGAFPLPSVAEMNAEIDRHRAWCDAVAGQEGILPKLVDEGKWRAWLHMAAGTGVNENLGYGIQGWLFWAREPRLCNMLQTGVESPHLLRLFDGRRQKWEGAREAIMQANWDIERTFGNKQVVEKTD